MAMAQGERFVAYEHQSGSDDGRFERAGGLAHTLKPLDRDGLVAISVDPEDRRNRLIRLTRMGRAKLAESDALWEAAASAPAGMSVLARTEVIMMMELADKTDQKE
jgi:DNA-binding MarR family transcriptional regulator